MKATDTDATPKGVIEMPVAGALVVPTRKESQRTLIEKLDALKLVTVKGVGDKGIAIVLETETMLMLEEDSHRIRNWDEVIDLHIAYLNWEDLEQHADHRSTASDNSSISGLL